jgi:uncharacterized protein (DUF2267 family)
MVDTGFATFSTTLDKTNRVLREIEQAYGWPESRRSQAYAALRSVLLALRDRLTVDESAQLAAQLPLLIRGLYFDGWDPSAVPVRMNREEFFERIRVEFPFDVQGGLEYLVQTVMHSLRHHISPGEWEDIEAGLPRDLKVVLV